MSDAQPITGCRPGDIAEHVFLCGDPARVGPISASWENTRTLCDVREYTIVTGEREGVALTAASTGIGAPSTAIVMEELAKLGAHTFIRVGNCGALAPSVELGDLVITTGAVREDGTSRAYVVPEYPAVASYELVAALTGAARETRAPHHAGITWSFDAFYARNAIAGPGNTLESMSFEGYWPPHLEARIRDMQAARILNCEMEAGIILTLAGLFGLRAAAICTVSDRTPWTGPAELDVGRNMAQCIDVANAAMLRVASSR
jgi:uridine phosphorylase